MSLQQGNAVLPGSLAKICSCDDYFFNDAKDLKKNLHNRVYSVIPNRLNAIKKAINIAQVGDCVVITGKAQEQTLNRFGKEHPWDEYEAVNKGLREINIL